MEVLSQAYKPTKEAGESRSTQVEQNLHLVFMILHVSETYAPGIQMLLALGIRAISEMHRPRHLLGKHCAWRKSQTCTASRAAAVSGRMVVGRTWTWRVMKQKGRRAVAPVVAPFIFFGGGGG